jgi:preprotein translocase subunit SecA
MMETAVREVVEEFCRPEDTPSRGSSRAPEAAPLDFFLMVEELPEKEEDEATTSWTGTRSWRWWMPAARAQFERKLESFGEHRSGCRAGSCSPSSTTSGRTTSTTWIHLKASISFRGWGQKDPLIEYKKEAYDMFVDLMTDIRKTVTSLFFRAQIGQPQPQPRQPQRLAYSGPQGPQDTGGAEAAARSRQAQPGRGGSRLDAVGVAAAARADAPAGGLPGAGPDPARLQTNRGGEAAPQQPVTAEDEPGRNDPCPCGSGKKYKKCHGRGG